MWILVQHAASCDILEQVALRWSSSSDVGARRGGCGYLCSILPLIAREDIKFVNCKPQYLLFYLTLWYLFTEQNLKR